MAYKTSKTNNIVRIIPLRLNKTQEQHCHALRREAGRCWSDMLQALPGLKRR